MIGIKDMNMPHDCWECELTHDNSSGLTLCNLTGYALYPMGARKLRSNDCPLIEFPTSSASSMEKLEPYIGWCERTGYELSAESYQEYLDQEDIGEHVI